MLTTEPVMLTVAILLPARGQSAVPGLEAYGQGGVRIAKLIFESPPAKDQ